MSPVLRTFRYTSRPPEEAAAWQRQLRAALTQALHMDDLVFEVSGLSFDTEEISAQDRQGYRLFELEFNSTRSRLTTMDQMEHNHCMCWKFDGLRDLADNADIYALTAPRALMGQNGLQEGETQFYVPVARQALAEIEPIYRDLGFPERLSLDVHDGGHEIRLPTLMQFFSRYLTYEWAAGPQSNHDSGHP